MDAVWRFLRTVAWASVGVTAVSFLIIPLLNAVNLGDWPGAAQIAVVGGLTVVGAGILALVAAGLGILKNPASAVQRAIAQFLQTLAAGALAPVVADTLLNTAVNYGRAWASLALAAIVAGLQSLAVNKREADPTVATPAPTPA